MKEILELIDVVKAMGQEESLRPRKDKVYELLKLIKSGADEEEAMKKLYPGSKYPETSLWKTKERLFGRSINSLLISKGNNETPAQRAYRECNKNYAAYKILIGKGLSRIAVKIAAQTLKKAVRFDFTDISVPLLKGLTKHYSYIEVDPRNYKKYLGWYREQKAIFDAENELEELLWEITFQISNKKRFSRAELNSFKNMKDRAIYLREKAKSYRTVLYCGNICAYYFQLNNEVGAFIQVCRDSIDYFAGFPKAPAAGRFSFLFKLIPAYIKTGDYNRGKTTIEQCLEIAPKGHINFIRTVEYKIILHLHEGKYREALQTLERHQGQNDKERFQILGAYCKLLNGQNIRLGRFLNEVPKYSKDKAGMNVNILIIQILSRLKKNDFPGIIDKLPALERYSYRYLKKDNTFRTNCFIHMILQLERGRFKKITTNEYTKNYHKKLASMPLSKSNQDIEVEIVPYEKLWEFIHSLLR